jgi:hypothetical protein
VVVVGAVVVVDVEVVDVEVVDVVDEVVEVEVVDVEVEVVLVVEVVDVEVVDVEVVDVEVVDVDELDDELSGMVVVVDDVVLVEPVEPVEPLEPEPRGAGSVGPGAPPEVLAPAPSRASCQLRTSTAAARPIDLRRAKREVEDPMRRRYSRDRPAAREPQGVSGGGAWRRPRSPAGTARRAGGR